MRGLRQLEQFLESSFTDRQRRELHLYDFDGTLFRSPGPPKWWNKKQHGYWYSDQASLEPPCVPEKPGGDWWVGPVVKSAKASIFDKEVWTIMCTGRLDKQYRWRIPQLLKQKGLSFDDVYLNPGAQKGFKGGQGDSTTFAWKASVVTRLNRKFGFTKLQVWEDNNMSDFRALSKKLGLPFEGHDVRVKPKPAECTQADFGG